MSRGRKHGRQKPPRRLRKHPQQKKHRHNGLASRPSWQGRLYCRLGALSRSAAQGFFLRRHHALSADCGSFAWIAGAQGCPGLVSPLCQADEGFFSSGRFLRKCVDVVSCFLRRLCECMKIVLLKISNRKNNKYRFWSRSATVRIMNAAFG